MNITDFRGRRGRGKIRKGHAIGWDLKMQPLAVLTGWLHEPEDFL